MNKFDLVGRVMYSEIKAFQNGKSKITFTLVYSISNRNNSFFRCESFEPSIIDNLQDGMIVQLLDYVPKTATWKDAQTGQNRSKAFLDVRSLELKGYHQEPESEKGTGFIVNEQPEPSNEMLEKAEAWEKELEQDTNKQAEIQKKEQEKQKIIDSMKANVDELIEAIDKELPTKIPPQEEEKPLDVVQAIKSTHISPKEIQDKFVQGWEMNENFFPEADFGEQDLEIDYEAIKQTKG